MDCIRWAQSHHRPTKHKNLLAIIFEEWEDGSLPRTFLLIPGHSHDDIRDGVVPSPLLRSFASSSDIASMWQQLKSRQFQSVQWPGPIEWLNPWLHESYVVPRGTAIRFIHLLQWLVIPFIGDTNFSLRCEIDATWRSRASGVQSVDVPEPLNASFSSLSWC